MEDSTRKHIELSTKRLNMEDRHITAGPAILHLSSILQNGSNNMSFHFVNPTKPKNGQQNQQIIHRMNEHGCWHD